MIFLVLVNTYADIRHIFRKLNFIVNKALLDPNGPFSVWLTCTPIVLITVMEAELVRYLHSGDSFTLGKCLQLNCRA